MRRHRHKRSPEQQAKLAAYLTPHPVLELICRFKQRLCNLLLRKHRTRKQCQKLIPGSCAPRCGAKSRRGTPCECPAMANGRCRLHGGLSTGPKTVEGRERIRRARWKHGRYSQRAVQERREERAGMRQFRADIAELARLVNTYLHRLGLPKVV